MYSYLEYGADFVHRLLGMFAIAIWDERQQRLLLARDRTGIKPLYYTLRDGRFVFGSEIKALLEHPAVSRELDEEAMDHYLTFLIPPAPLTMFRNIMKLEPGHMIAIGKDGVPIKSQYWDPADRPYAMLRSSQLPQSRRVVIGHTDRWIAPDAIRRLAEDDRSLLQLDGADALAWTGWASVPGAMLRSPLPNCDQRALGMELTRRGLRPSVLGGPNPAPPLDAQSLLRAQRAVIAGSAEAPLPAEWTTMPWGAVSPRARIHHEADIVGPVLIGPGCLVAAGASVGPNTVLSQK